MIEAEHLASEIGDFYRRMHRLLDRRMKAGGASLARTKLLLYLEQGRGEARAADIAEFFCLAPRTVTDALDALERDGMVRREPDPHDRRVKRLSITEAGRAATAATEPLRLEMMHQIFDVLDSSEREAIQRLLGKISTAVGELESNEKD